MRLAPARFGQVGSVAEVLPEIASKRFVYGQYDSTVRTNTVQGPGGSAAGCAG